jgi:hypothetical protein
MTLRRSPDRRIAGHVRDGVLRQRAEPNVRAQARRRVGGLTARMPGTDHDYVKAVLHTTTQPEKTGEIAKTAEKSLLGDLRVLRGFF